MVGASVLILFATLASGCSTIQDGQGHWDMGSGATPATGELQPLPPGFVIMFNQIVHDGGSANTDSRYVLISQPSTTPAQTASADVEKYLRKGGLQHWVRNSAALADGDCIVIGTPQEAFGAPAVSVLTDPRLPPALRAAIRSAKGPVVVAAYMGVC